MTAAIAALGGWEVRRRSRRLELRHAGISIIGPALEGPSRFEIERDGVRIVVRHWTDVVARITDVPLPDLAEIAALHTWLIVRDKVERARGHL